MKDIQQYARKIPPYSFHANTAPNTYSALPITKILCLITIHASYCNMYCVRDTTFPL